MTASPRDRRAGLHREGPALPSGAASFAGIPLWTGTVDDAVATVLEDARTGGGRAFRLVNAYSLYCAHADADYAALLAGSGVNFIDGKPLASVIRRFDRTGVIDQVRGPGLFERCMDAGRDQGCRHFLLGGPADLLAELREELERRYPGVVIAGSHAPPYRPFTARDRAAFRRAIKAARPHVVWVGLGTPRQDIEATDLAARLGLTTVAVGAAFDFSAGRKPEAPALLQTLGLEWCFRLWSEPARLWRRYLFGNTYFLAQAGREGLARLRNRPSA